MSFKSGKNFSGTGKKSLDQVPALNSSPGYATLDKGSKIVGKLKFAGRTEINGEVEGEIYAEQTLLIGESAVIQGSIEAAEVVVLGTVKGDIIAAKKLSLKAPAKVSGNISSVLLSIEEGVLFEGKCQMLEPIASKVAPELKKDDATPDTNAKPNVSSATTSKGQQPSS